MIFAPFRDDHELKVLMDSFDNQTLAQLDWTHREHLAVATVYAKRHGSNSVDWMRKGIKALNAAHGVADTPTGGYHETLTIAWMKLMGELVDRHAEMSEVELVNEALLRFADKRALLAFYSRETIMSSEARTMWVEPDRLALGLDQLEVGNNL